MLGQEDPEVDQEVTVNAKSVVLIVGACAAAALVAGCAGPATFVSPTAPPEAVGEAWFQADVQPVRTAVARAMFEGGVTLDVKDSKPSEVAGVIPQYPYAPQGQAPPASEKPATYHITAALSSVGLDTYVRFTIDADCPGCNGTTEYVWDYPVEIMRDIYQRADDLLMARWQSIAYSRPYHRGFWRPYHRGRRGWGGWGWESYGGDYYGAGTGGEEGHLKGAEGEGGQEDHNEGGTEEHHRADNDQEHSHDGE
jgi:hypothetical protein